jgi:hypothetical protein
MLVLRCFFLKQCTPGSHLDKTPYLFFFINYLACHKNSHVTAHLLKMKLPSRVALDTQAAIIYAVDSMCS